MCGICAGWIWSGNASGDNDHVGTIGEEMTKKAKDTTIEVHPDKAEETEHGLAKVPVTVGTARHLILTDDPKWITEAMVQACAEIAKQEGISISGLNILGGRFYINTGGLDNKVENRCKKEKLKKKSIFVEELKADIYEEGGAYFSYRGVVELFDDKGFQHALETVAKSGAAITPEAIDKLRDIYVFRYSDIGAHQSDAERMSTIKQASNLQMKASRKATNRAKRLATSCGLTSVEEMDTDLARPVPQGRLQAAGGGYIPPGQSQPPRPAAPQQAAPIKDESQLTRVIYCTFLGNKMTRLQGDGTLILHKSKNIGQVYGGRWLGEIKAWEVKENWVPYIAEECEKLEIELIEKGVAREPGSEEAPPAEEVGFKATDEDVPKF